MALYDTEGELRYGLQYADSVHRKIDLDQVQAWLKDARQQGSVGVLIRVGSTSEMREAGQLPPGASAITRGTGIDRVSTTPPHERRLAA